MERKWSPFQFCCLGVHDICCWNQKLAHILISCLHAQSWNRIGERHGGQEEACCRRPLPPLFPYRPPSSFPYRRRYPTGQGEGIARHHSLPAVVPLLARGRPPPAAPPLLARGRPPTAPPLLAKERPPPAALSFPSQPPPF
jgi:hypothetical protein